MEQIARPASRSGWRAALFVIGCGALLAPIWMVKYPPLTDYPNHLASSFVLAHLRDPRFRFSTLYEANWNLTPYVAADAALVALQHFLPVELAGRILLSVSVLAAPASVWFFLRQVGANDGVAVAWAFVFAYNIFFLFGFLEYCLSIAGCFAVLGLWLRYLRRPSAQRWTGLFAAVVALYFIHVVGFAMAGLIITMYAIVRRLPIRQIGLSWLPFVPGVVLLLWSRVVEDVAGSTSISGGIIRKLAWLFAWLEVRPGPFEPINLAVFALLATAGVVLVWKNADLRWNRDWAVVAAVLFAAYWVLPSGFDFGGRLLPFLFVLIFVAVDIGRRGRWVVTLAIAVLIVRMVSLTQHFIGEQTHLTRLARSFEVVPANVRVLTMVGPVVEPAASRGYFTSLLFNPQSFWGYGIIQRGWVAPYLFTTFQGLHALRLAEEPYPPRGWGPQTEALLDWERIRRSYDYVWAYRAPQLSPRLHTIGELVFADEGLEVFKMR